MKALYAFATRANWAVAYQGIPQLKNFPCSRVGGAPRGCLHQPCPFGQQVTLWGLIPLEFL
ncbi:hypothetical protein F4X88_14250 [Candidatus Poribacteria bacterium]|nr:hypothetical protein [Candidatus Poribacteria bacterium]MYA57452.1 hypothetical protein [Candidatus Poribacteria bacterium]